METSRGSSGVSGWSQGSEGGGPAMIHVNSQAEFARSLRDAGTKLVVVDFFATWCGPCKRIAPQLEELAASHPDVVFLKVDIDELEDIAMEYKVVAMPTFHFIKKGKRLDSVTGANVDKVLSLVKKYK